MHDNRVVNATWRMKNDFHQRSCRSADDHQLGVCLSVSEAMGAKMQHTSVWEIERSVLNVIVEQVPSMRSNNHVGDMI